MATEQSSVVANWTVAATVGTMTRQFVVSCPSRYDATAFQQPQLHEHVLASHRPAELLKQSLTAQSLVKPTILLLKEAFQQSKVENSSMILLET